MTDLYPHQVAALQKLDNGKILWGGVGSGKTRVAVEYYLLREAPRRVYVITTAKKRDDRDWQEEFYRAGVGPLTGPNLWGGEVPARGAKRPKSRDGSGSDGPNGVLQAGNSQVFSCAEVADCGCGRHEMADLAGYDRRAGEAGTYPYVVTVDSWNNIAKYADVVGAFFIFDEQRLVGSGNWTRKFLRIAKRNRWILLSATPGDTWMDYIPVFVANNFYKNRTEFLREHVVYNNFTKFPKVDRYINVGRLARQRAKLLVEMPYVRHTKRRHVEVELSHDKDALDLVLTKRWHVFEDRPLMDVAEMFSVARKIVNSDPSRLEMVKELWKNHPKLIIFYNFNYELEALRTLGGVGAVPFEKSTGSTKTPSELSYSTTKLLETNPVSKISSMPTTTTTSIDTSGSRDTRSEGWKDPGLTKLSGKSSNAVKTKKDGTSRESLQTQLIDWSTSLPKEPKEGALHADEHGPRRRSQVTSLRSELCATPVDSESIAEWNGHKHQPVPSTDRWLYLVQYTAGAEGWNCIETDAMIMFSRTYSWKIYEQAQGRIDRLNSPFIDLWYYNFMSNSWIDKAIGRSLKAKENFNEAKYVRMLKG